MRHDIAFLHTSPVHVATFERLVGEMSPVLRVRHVVAEDLLAEAQRWGADDPALVRRVHQAMVDAAATGARVAVCTCSTIGGAAEGTETQGAFLASRIDRAMADRAASLGPRVLVVAALASTVTPTVALVEDSAVRLGRRVQVRTLVVADAWHSFLDGDTNVYVARIADAVRAASSEVDVIVLAQASMAPAAALLHGLGCEVLSSPALGVRAALDALRLPEG